MKTHHISFKKTNFFSKTILDYLEEKENIRLFYHHFPNLKGFQKQIEEKKQSYQQSSRTVLVNTLKEQYKNIDTSERTLQNIEALRKENTFTITTGHQLNLFTGPLYFLYKIISTINLCEELKEKFPKHHFVPIYWMATEDHDFDEINFFNFKGKKVQWNRKDGGAVGEFSTEGLNEVFKVFSQHLGDSKQANTLKELFRNTYLESSTLSEATRKIANALFGKYGLVILDANNRNLKKLFTPFIAQEILEKNAFTSVSKTNAALEKNYAIQVNPREINLFYLTPNRRERIVLENGIYKVNNTAITFSKEEIRQEIAKNPAHFSPNVIMRPVYQEVILPNLCYIGGGGEIAYWLQLKEYFKNVCIPFPILLLRNSVQIISEKQQKKLQKLQISKEEIFLKTNDLLRKKVIENSEITLNFSEKRAFLQQQFQDLKVVAQKTDVSFLNAVNAQEKKQLKGINHLEKRLLKAEKRRQSELVHRITMLQNELLPHGSLEERQRNFSELYLHYGEAFIPTLKKVLKPLQLEFTLLEL